MPWLLGPAARAQDGQYTCTHALPGQVPSVEQRTLSSAPPTITFPHLIRPAAAQAQWRPGQHPFAEGSTSHVSPIDNHISPAAAACCCEGAMTARTAPSATCAPGSAASSATVPGRGARTVCSIFMASSTTSAAPSSTSSPSPTSTCQDASQSMAPLPANLGPFRCLFLIIRFNPAPHHNNDRGYPSKETLTRSTCQKMCTMVKARHQSCRR